MRLAGAVPPPGGELGGGSAEPLEHRALRDARAAVAGVTRVALVAPLTAVVALHKQHDDEPARIIEAMLDDTKAEREAAGADAVSNKAG